MNLLKLILLFPLISFGAEKGQYHIGTPSSITAATMENFTEVREAVKSYGLGDRGHQDCALVMISNTGYALTARHCLYSIIRQSPFAKEKKHSERISYMDIDQEELKKTRVELTILENASFDKPLTGETMLEYFEAHQKSTKKVPVKIIGLLPGLTTKDVTENVEMFALHRPESLGFFSDYALLKFDGDQHSCVKTTDHRFGDEVVAIGYPSAKPSILGAGEINPPVVSVGEVCEYTDRSFDGVLGLFEDAYRILYKMTFDKYIEDLKLINKTYSSDFIFHSALISPGSSGGGLFNKKGELVGINVGHTPFSTPQNPENPFGLWSPEKTYLPGSYMALPIGKIKQFLKEQGHNLGEIFACK